MVFVGSVRKGFIIFSVPGISRRYSPVLDQIYLLKIASIYRNFTQIGG